MKLSKLRNKIEQQRKGRVRARLAAVGKYPRLSIFRSNTNLYVQVIDDAVGKTVASGSLKDVATGKKRVEKAEALGKLIAEKAKKAGVTNVVFDRGSYAYHGRVKAVADGARAGGLKF